MDGTKKQTGNIVFARIGAFCFVLWGVMHIVVGGLMLRRSMTAGGIAAVELLGRAFPSDGFSPTVAGVTTALIEQHAWDLLWFGAFAVVVGVTMNWKNSRTGYWFNLAIVSLADVGFIVAIVIPGYTPLVSGLSAPALWILGAAFSGLALRGKAV